MMSIQSSWIMVKYIAIAGKIVGCVLTLLLNFSVVKQHAVLMKSTDMNIGMTTPPAPPPLPLIAFLVQMSVWTMTECIL